MRMPFLKIWTLFVSLMLAGQLGGWAAYEYKMDQRMSSGEQFESGSMAKFGRGVTNVMYGWTELMSTPTRIAADPRHGGFYSATVGIPLGIARMIGRTLVGAYEVVTFMAPQPPIFDPLEGDVL